MRCWCLWRVLCCVFTAVTVASAFLRQSSLWHNVLAVASQQHPCRLHGSFAQEVPKILGSQPGILSAAVAIFFCGLHVVSSKNVMRLGLFTEVCRKWHWVIVLMTQYEQKCVLNHKQYITTATLKVDSSLASVRASGLWRGIGLAFVGRDHGTSSETVQCMPVMSRGSQQQDFV